MTRIVRTFLLAALLLSMTLSACQCDVGGVNEIPDAGFDAGPPEPDAGVPPPPPIFPLKPGDVVEVPVIGARTEPCDGIAGDCDRVINASYTIVEDGDGGVMLDDDSGRWRVRAEFLYTLVKASTTYEAISRLFVSKLAPFDVLMDENANQAGTGTFRTDAANTDEATANDFPFFHYEVEYANRPESAYKAAAGKFSARIRAIDPQAEIEAQPASAVLAAVFRDELGANVYLHQVEVQFHPFGIMCGYIEQVIPWTDGMARSTDEFDGKTPPIAASFQSIRVVRDGQRYTCSCFDNLCKAFVDGETVCLDPTDPDRPATTDACSGN